MQLSDFPSADWSRAIVANRTDHVNDVMVVQFVFLFIARAIKANQKARGLDKFDIVVLKSCQIVTRAFITLVRETGKSYEDGNYADLGDPLSVSADHSLLFAG